MKQIVVAMLLACAIAVASPVHGEMAGAPTTDEYDEMQSHPFRIAAYLVYPVGFTLEWLIFRPFHSLVAQPSLAPVFGHTPHGDESSTVYN